MTVMHGTEDLGREQPHRGRTVLTLMNCNRHLGHRGRA